MHLMNETKPVISELVLWTQYKKKKTTRVGGSSTRIHYKAECEHKFYIYETRSH